MKIIIPLSLFVSGCALGTGIRELQFNGETIYEAKCNGAIRSQAHCMEQASKYCALTNKKVAIINNEQSSVIVPSNGSFISGVNRSTLFKCQ